MLMATFAQPAPTNPASPSRRAEPRTAVGVASPRGGPCARDSLAIEPIGGTSNCKPGYLEAAPGRTGTVEGAGSSGALQRPLCRPRPTPDSHSPVLIHRPGNPPYLGHGPGQRSSNRPQTRCRSQGLDAKDRRGSLPSGGPCASVATTSCRFADTARPSSFANIYESVPCSNPQIVL
jgi:hypothetical protein